MDTLLLVLTEKTRGFLEYSQFYAPLPRNSDYKKDRTWSIGGTDIYYFTAPQNHLLCISIPGFLPTTLGEQKKRYLRNSLAISVNS
jgi:hypothetical protein